MGDICGTATFRRCSVARCALVVVATGCSSSNKNAATPATSSTTPTTRPVPNGAPAEYARDDLLVVPVSSSQPPQLVAYRVG